MHRFFLALVCAAMVFAAGCMIHDDLVKDHCWQTSHPNLADEHGARIRRARSCTHPASRHTEMEERARMRALEEKFKPTN